MRKEREDGGLKSGRGYGGTPFHGHQGGYYRIHLIKIGETPDKSLSECGQIS
jgi:hypothetical protein